MTTDPHQIHRDRLVAQLRANGVLDETWAPAFAAVPRHVLVPRWYTPSNGNWLSHTAAEDPAGAYADETLVTALDGGTVGIPTSSSTAPGLMAGMLRGLDVHDGTRVLEIGTGTGYTTALLCERLGSENVYSIDVQPEVVDAARQRLNAAGYTPTLATGDGRQRQLALDAPVERIIATCSVPYIPPAWIDQLAQGGLILAAIDLGIESGAVALRLNGRKLEGSFTRHTVSFMPARFPNAPTGAQRLDYAPTTATRPTRLTAGIIQDHYAYRILLASRLPDVQRVMWTDGAERALQLQKRDGSAWARVPLNDAETSPTVTYGDTDLWAVAEQTWTDWQLAGRPAHDTYRVTQHDGELTIHE
ncbi:methyltransferase domain-containing protein [Spiractinospora alimapuensis]|uniref:methyltransferase domain-containing protein n=1 Tax=Spiractinospora alimapuensis TaxID=2820884 RepID=UPI001F460490|nr:methyltransferase domain-containing protein [Spiractinospora alimapuensis]QVQ52152.1 methyltransferase domain-containing protein [Spiractinospora alimapuensis]